MLLITHEWDVTYQREPITMRGFFASVEEFERRRRHWLTDRPTVRNVRLVVATPATDDDLRTFTAKLHARSL